MPPWSPATSAPTRAPSPERGRGVRSGRTPPRPRRSGIGLATRRRTTSRHRPGRLGGDDLPRVPRMAAAGIEGRLVLGMRSVVGAGAVVLVVGYEPGDQVSRNI